MFWYLWNSKSHLMWYMCSLTLFVFDVSHRQSFHSFFFFTFSYTERETHGDSENVWANEQRQRFSFQRATQWFSTLKMKCWDFLTVFFFFSSCSFNWSRLMCVLQPYRKWYQPCLKAAMDVCLQSVILAQVNNSFLTKKISQSQSLPLSTFCMTCQYLTTYQFYSFHDGERQRDLDFDFSYLTWNTPLSYLIMKKKCAVNDCK